MRHAIAALLLAPLVLLAEIPKAAPEKSGSVAPGPTAAAPSDPVPVLTVGAATGPIWALGVSNSAGRLFAASEDGLVQAFRFRKKGVAAGREDFSAIEVDAIRGFYSPEKGVGGLGALAVSPDGRQLAVGGTCSLDPNAEVIRFYDTDSLAPLRTVTLRDAQWISALRWTQDGRYVLCVAHQGIRVIETHTWTHERSLDLEGAFSPMDVLTVHGKYVVYAARKDPATGMSGLVAWRLGESQPFTSIPAASPSQWVGAVASDPQSGRIAFALNSTQDSSEIEAEGNGQNFVVLCDASLNELSRIDQGLVNANTGLAFSPDGRFLTTGAAALSTHPKDFMFPNVYEVAGRELRRVARVGNLVGSTRVIWVTPDVAAYVDGVYVNFERIEPKPKAGGIDYGVKWLWGRGPSGPISLDTVDWVPGGIGFRENAPAGALRHTGMYPLEEAFDFSTLRFRSLNGKEAEHRNPSVDSGDLHVRTTAGQNGFWTSQLNLYRGDLPAASPEYGVHESATGGLVYSWFANYGWSSATLDDHYLYATPGRSVYVIDRYVDPFIANRSAPNASFLDTEGHSLDFELLGAPNMPTNGGPSPDGQWYAIGGNNGNITFWSLAGAYLEETVTQVVDGGASAEAGVKAKDVITGLDGRRFKTWSAWRTYQALHDEVDINVKRDGNDLVFHLKKRAGKLGYSSSTNTIRIEPTFHLLLGSRSKDGSRPWLIWTPRGFFDGSDEGVRMLGWLLNHSPAEPAEFVRSDKLYAKFFQPELIHRVISTGRSDVAVASEMKLNGDLAKALHGVPRVEIHAASSAAATKSRKVALDLSVEDTGGGVGSIALRINGKRVPAEQWSKGSTAKPAPGHYAVEVDLPGGDNTIEASATNSEGTYSENAGLQVVSGQPPTPGKLYLELVGMAQYADPKTAPTRSPTSLASLAMVGAQFDDQSPCFTQVVRRGLINGEATKDDFFKELGYLAQTMQPQDTLVLVIFTHGNNFEGPQGVREYTMCMYDASWDGSVPVGHVTAGELEGLLSAIPAQKQLLVLETCFSGAGAEQILNLNANMRKGVQSLSQGAGLAAISACSDTQESWSDAELGSYFLDSLIEELDDVGASGSPVSCQALLAKVRSVGAVSMGWSAEAALKVDAEYYSKYVQQPFAIGQGQDFPLGVVRSFPLRSRIPVGGNFSIHFDQPSSGRVWVIPNLNLPMAPVAPGRFTMGSPESELGRKSPAETQHEVTLTKEYWIGQWSVRVQDFRLFVESTGYQTDAERLGGVELWQDGDIKRIPGTSWQSLRVSQSDDEPVTGVSWNDAMAFCSWLTDREHAAGRIPQGYAYALPTEAQWEYACRAGTTGPFAGDLTAIAWYDEEEGWKHPVAQKAPNAWGLFDMSGNVTEWCFDFYSDDITGNLTDPAGPIFGERRSYRGASWRFSSRFCRSASRGFAEPKSSQDSSGFRVALVPQSAALDSGFRAAASGRPPLQTELPSEGQPWTVPGIKLPLVPIAPGTFTMGSPEGEPERDAGEIPHEVHLTKPFWIGQWDVRISDFRAFYLATCYATDAEKSGGIYFPQESGGPERRAGTNCWNPGFKQDENYPVVGVSWNDARAFGNWLTNRERSAGRLPPGYVYSVPTEAQWEYACRAGTTDAYGGDLDSMAWYRTNSDSATHPVGQRQANGWGLYDMHGNVHQWCLDARKDYSPGSITDPVEGYGDPNPSGGHVIRGGSWSSLAQFCRSASRQGFSADYSQGTIGFRIALIPDPSPGASTAQPPTASDTNTKGWSDYARNVLARAQAGEAEAQDLLGVIYQSGSNGVAQDRSEANRWYLKSAEQGYVFAQDIIGRAYLYGEGVTADYSKAAYWLEKAAAQNDSDSEYVLGRMYSSGTGKEKDLAKSLEMYRRASEHGNEYAMADLGWIYLNGTGVDKNLVEALRWYKAGAEKEAPDAEEMMGEFYDPAYHWGVLQPDVEEARKWYTKAIERGSDSAKDRLAKLPAASSGP